MEKKQITEYTFTEDELKTALGLKGDIDGIYYSTFTKKLTIDIKEAS